MNSAENVGILAMETYFPRGFVDQSELEQFDGIGQGKYTLGLGQKQMAFCSDDEDVQSICLTVLANILTRLNLNPNCIGYLSVGTETLIDKSKSVKTTLMDLMGDNTDVEGLDVKNACFGGTQALFNAIDWVIANFPLDGRLALVVMGDIAVYDAGPARCTGGVGASALLIGPNAPLMVDRGSRAFNVQHRYDFYKPVLDSEYPVLDGNSSVRAYFSALDQCYRLYQQKIAKLTGVRPNLSHFDSVLFHTPYCRLVQKALARLVYQDHVSPLGIDYLQCHQRNRLDTLRGVSLDETMGNRKFQTVTVSVSEEIFRRKTEKSLFLASKLGNMYTASLYGGLCSLLLSPLNDLVGQKILLFSYGSGSVAAMFSITITDDIDDDNLRMLQNSAFDCKLRLDTRIKYTPNQFNLALKMRENLIGKAPYTPRSISPNSDNDYNCPHFPGTFLLKEVDEKFRRKYERCANDQMNGSGLETTETAAI